MSQDYSVKDLQEVRDKAMLHVDNMFTTLRAEMLSWVETMFGDTVQAIAMKKHIKRMTQGHWYGLQRKILRDFGEKASSNGNSILPYTKIIKNI